MHRELDENLFIALPQGSETPASHICKLKKALYWLKQIPRQLYKTFSSKLMYFGFQQSHHDHCLFFMAYNQYYIDLIVYVDDILVIGTDNGKIS